MYNLISKLNNNELQGYTATSPQPAPTNNLWLEAARGNLTEEQKTYFLSDAFDSNISAEQEAYNKRREEAHVYVFGDNNANGYWKAASKNKWANFSVSQPDFDAEVGFTVEDKPEVYKTWSELNQNKFDQLVEDGTINSQAALEYYTQDYTEKDTLESHLAYLDITDQLALGIIHELKEPTFWATAAIAVFTGGIGSAPAVVRVGYSAARIGNILKKAALLSAGAAITEGVYNGIKTQTNHNYDGYDAARDTLFAMAAAPVFGAAIHAPSAIISKFSKKDKIAQEGLEALSNHIDDDGIVYRATVGHTGAEADEIASGVREVLQTGKGRIKTDFVEQESSNFNIFTRSIYAATQKNKATEQLGQMLFSDPTNSNKMGLTVDVLSANHMSSQYGQYAKTIHNLLGAVYRERNGALTLNNTIDYRGFKFSSFQSSLGDELNLAYQGKSIGRSLTKNEQKLIDTLQQMNMKNGEALKRSGADGMKDVDIDKHYLPQIYSEDNINNNVTARFTHISNIDERIVKTTDTVSDTFYHAIKMHADNLELDDLAARLTARTLTMGAMGVKEASLSRIKYSIDDILNNEDVFKEVALKMAMDLKRRGFNTTDEALKKLIKDLTPDEIATKAHKLFKDHLVLNKKVNDKSNFSRTKYRIKLDAYARASNGLRVHDFIETDIFKLTNNYTRETAGMSAFSRIGITNKKKLIDTLDDVEYRVKLVDGQNEAEAMRRKLESGIDLIMQRPTIKVSPTTQKIFTSAKNYAHSALLGSAGLAALPSVLSGLMDVSFLGALHTMPLLRKLTYKNAVHIMEEYKAFGYAIEDLNFAKTLGFGEEVDGMNLGKGSTFLDRLTLRSDQFARWTDTIALTRGVDNQSKFMISVMQSNELVKAVKKGKGLNKFGIRGTDAVKKRIEQYIDNHSVLEKGVIYDKVQTLGLDRWLKDGELDSEAIDTFFAILKDSVSRVTNESLAGHHIASLVDNIPMQLALQFKALLLRAYEKQFLYVKRGISQDVVNKSLGLVGSLVGMTIAYNGRNHLNSLTMAGSDRQRYLESKTLDFWTDDDVSKGKIALNWLQFMAQSDMLGFLSFTGLRSDSVSLSDAITPAVFNYASQTPTAFMQMQSYLVDGNPRDKHNAMNNLRRTLPIFGNFWGTKLVMGVALEDE